MILAMMWAFDTTLDRRTPGAGLLAPLNVTAYVAWLAAAASGLLGHSGNLVLSQVQWAFGTVALMGFLGAFCVRAILEDRNASDALLGGSVIGANLGHTLQILHKESCRCGADADDGSRKAGISQYTGRAYRCDSLLFGKCLDLCGSPTFVRSTRMCQNEPNSSASLSVETVAAPAGESMILFATSTDFDVFKCGRSGTPKASSLRLRRVTFRIMQD